MYIHTYDTYMHTYIYLSIYMNIYIDVYIYICICLLQNRGQQHLEQVFDHAGSRDVRALRPREWGSMCVFVCK
jgi:hypothetical protein